MSRLNKFLTKLFNHIISEENKNLWFIFSIFILYLLFNKSFNELIEFKTLDTLEKNINGSISDTIFILLLFFTILFLLWKFKNEKYIPSINGIISCFLILIVYLSHRIPLFSYQTWHFTNFSFSKYLTYADVVYLFIIVLLLDLHKPLPKSKEINRSFIEDDFRTFGKSDLYKREKFATDISNHIIGTNTNNSFAIGIVGKWGSGKSIFLNQIYDILESQCVTIRFNPWRNKDSKQIIEDFLLELTSKIKPYNPNISKQIEKYSESLVSVDSGVLSKILKPLHETFNSPKPIQEQYESIRACLKELKIVIFVDDLDRLDTDEVLEVLRIIRNTANFPNTFFIVAYDQSYILNSLKKSKIPEVDRYLEKIFQIEIALPSYPDSIILNGLLKLLKENLSEVDYIQVEGSLKMLSKLPSDEPDINHNFDFNLIKYYLLSLRDVVRFVNSFKLNYIGKQEDIDLVDFIILELVKLKYHEQYVVTATQLTSNSAGIYFDINGTESNKQIKFNEQNFTSHFIDVIKKEDIILLIKTFKYLFNRERLDSNILAVSNPENSLRYFASDLFDKISFKEFKESRRQGVKKFIEKIDQWINDKKGDELANILSKTILFENREDYEVVVKGMVYLSTMNFPNWRQEVFARLNMRWIIKDAYEENIELYKNFIQSIFTEAKYPFAFESSLALDFLYPILRGEPENTQLFSSLELKKIIVRFLDDYCKNERSNQVDENVYRLYYNSQEHINSNDNKITIIKEANEIFRRFVEKNKTSYFENLIRPLYSPHDGKTYTLEPFVEQIFDGFENFENLIEVIPFQRIPLEVKSFYKKYKTNKYKPIEVDRRIIDIFSDEEVKFLFSDSFPSIPTNTKTVSYSHPNQVNILKEHPIFASAKWIAHQYPIPDIEASEGGNYMLQYDFNSEIEEIEIKQTRLLLYVDDDCSVSLNGLEINPRANYGAMFEYKLKILKGKNILKFNIHNADLRKNSSDVFTGVNNPYGIIYIIQIEFIS